MFSKGAYSSKNFNDIYFEIHSLGAIDRAPNSSLILIINKLTFSANFLFIVIITIVIAP